MERFIGILIEHYAGAMPLWLAPVQVMVLNISEGQSDYATRVATALKQAGCRCEADLRNEKITYKIREHSLQKLPYQLIVGEKEKAAEKVAVRTRSGEDLGQVSLPEFIARLRAEAMKMAEEAEVDLVEIAPLAKPPVCKLMDYGKFKYREAKKAHEAKLKQKQIHVKEVKFRPGTDEGDKAKVTLR